MLIERLLYPQLAQETQGVPDGGAPPDASPAPAEAPPPSPSPGEAPGEPAAPADAPIKDSTRAMHDAIFGKKKEESGEEPQTKPKETLGIPKPPEKAPADKPGAQKKGEDAFAVPAGLTPQAAKRFHTLVDEVKQVKKESEQHQVRAAGFEKRVNDFTSIMHEARATPADFQTFVEFIAAQRSGDYAKAKAILLHQIRELSIASGENILGSTDVFSEFPELAKSVEDMQVPEAAAMEVVKARRILAAQRQQQQTVAQQEEARRQWEGHKVDAMGKISQMTAAWRGQDIDFARKEPKIAERIARLQEFHPSLWPRKVQELYDDMTDAVQTFGAPTNGGGNGGPRPLRGGTAPSATARVPANMFEAIFQAPKPT